MPKVLLTVLRLTLVCLLQLTLFSVSASPVLAFDLDQASALQTANLQQHLWPSDSVSSQRMRSALRALLALNDGELQSVLGGAPPSIVAQKLSPSTLLFLAAAKIKLQKMRQSLPHVKSIPGDMSIAKRRKNRKKYNANKADPDSLITALEQLSDYVERRHERPIKDWDIKSKQNKVDKDLKSIVKSRSRRSHKDRNAHHHKKHDNCYHQFHPEFWFRPRACPPSSDGSPQLFCPTPDSDGNWVCIHHDDLCDESLDCPDGADELPQSCMFYQPMRDQLEEIAFILSRIV